MAVKHLTAQQVKDLRTIVEHNLDLMRSAWRDAVYGKKDEKMVEYYACRVVRDEALLAALPVGKSVGCDDVSDEQDDSEDEEQ